MAFDLPKLNAPLLVVAMGAMVLSTGAQQSDRSIIFSTPNTDDAQAATPSPSPQNSQVPVLPGSLQAPDSAFNFQAPNDLPALPPPTANTPQDQRMKKMLEERKNWTLMTPAEILGVTPTEELELLQPPEHDATGREKNPTQLERYLDRENQLRGGLTNGLPSDQDNSPWNYSRDRDSLNPFDPGRDNTADAAQKLSQFLNSRPNGDAAVNRKEKSFGWDSFSPPAPQAPVKPDLEQMAAMERFRQLLEASPDTTSGPSPDSKFSPMTKAVPILDPNITQPDFVPNPAGASFMPLTSGIGKPAGLTPLPGIVTAANPAVAVPAWSPQPPPWLSQGPQLFVMPQRKF
jgi:hypothetical protein